MPPPDLALTRLATAIAIAIATTTATAITTATATAAPPTFLRPGALERW